MYIDSEYLPVRFLLFILLLALSFLFSGSEAAFFSLREEEIRDKNFYPFTLVRRIVSDREALLTTLLLGNEIVNVASSSIVANLFMDLFGDRYVGFSSFISFFAILNFGEFLPKVVAVKYNHLWVTTSAPIIVLLMYITYPFRLVLYLVGRVASSLISEEDESIELVVEHATKSGVLDMDEGSMIREAIAFTELTAKDVMTPEPYMFMIDVNWSKEEIRGKVKTCYYSKIPVYENSRDNVVGYVKITDLVARLFDDNGFNLREIIRPVHFVPESRSIVDVIEDFRRYRLELVIVVDEYGSVVGLITIDDVIEEIVGDIVNEHEERKEYIEVVGENRFIVGGLTKIEDFIRYIDLPIDVEQLEVDTVGGLVFHLHGRIPMEGTTVRLGNVIFKVIKMEGKRVKEVLVEVKEDDEVSGDEG